jgi:hypothetical protein
MYLSVRTYTEKIANPYYSPNNSRIESQYIDETRTTNTFYYNLDQLKEHIKSNASKVFPNSTYHYYKVEEIKPIVYMSVTVDI